MHALSASQTSLPSYHYEPQETEQRLAQHLRAREGRSLGSFVKNSRSGGVTLRLSGQENDAALPEYGRGACVDGTIEILKGESIQSVEVKIEGSLKLKEIAEGGTSTSTLCLDVKTLWSKDHDSPSSSCPSSLPFALILPDTFSDGKAEYPLPPTYEAHLSGVPGFRANIDYSVTAVVYRSKVSFFGLAHTVLSTPFLYRPRSRPALPLPAPLLTSVHHPSLIQSDNWALFQTTIKAKSSRNDDITAMLYLPNPRVFSMTESIPFHLIFNASPVSLTAFLPLTPTQVFPRAVPTSPLSSSSNSAAVSPTRIQLLRQTSVDVRSIAKKTPLLRGNNTDIWKTTQIGEAVFRHDDGDMDSNVARKEWMAWSGEVVINPDVRVAAFKASGLTVKDYLVLCVTSPDPGKSAFADTRFVTPIRLTTDPWTGDLSADNFGGYDYSDPALADGGNGPNMDEQPALSY